MSIDNFRRPKPRHVRRQAIDGIIGAPSGPRPTHDEVPFTRRPMPGQAPVRRRVDDFSRAEGYHPIAQQAMRQPVAQKEQSRGQSHGHSQHMSAAPTSLINKTIAPHARQFENLEDHKPTKRRGKRNWHRVRTWTFRMALVAGLVIFITAGMLFAKGYFKLHQVFKGTNSAAALQANVNPNLLKGEGDGRVNILLLGVGGAGHDGPDLTDTILLASVDPVNNKVSLLSVPRDLWVKEPNNFMNAYGKINAAYESGKYKYLGKLDASNANQGAITAGFSSIDKTITHVIGVPIDYNVVVDFQAFKQAVDTVGGVTTNVPTELYDPTMAWENHWNPVLAKAGVQTMNGKQALLYARSRETSSDFARTQRQRALLIALKDKVLSLGVASNPIKISGLISAFGDNVRTDISLNDAQALFNIVKKVSSSNIDSIGLADPPNNFVTTANINGISVVEPRAGEFSYKEIQDFVHSKLRDGYLAKENASINILNGTAIPGVATTLASTLKTYGYNVGNTGNAPTQTYQATVVVDLSNGADKYTKHYLEQRFGVSSVGKLPDSSIQPGNAKFVIIIGQDEATKISGNQT